MRKEPLYTPVFRIPSVKWKWGLYSPCPSPHPMLPKPASCGLRPSLQARNEPPHSVLALKAKGRVRRS